MNQAVISRSFDCSFSTVGASSRIVLQSLVTPRFSPSSSARFSARRAALRASFKRKYVDEGDESSRKLLPVGAESEIGASSGSISIVAGVPTLCCPSPSPTRDCTATGSATSPVFSANHSVASGAGKQICRQFQTPASLSSVNNHHSLIAPNRVYDEA